MTKTIIVCVGDSITEGHNLYDNNPNFYSFEDDITSMYLYWFFKQLNNNLEPVVTQQTVSDGGYISKLDHPDATHVLYNCGHGGYRVDQLIPRFDYDVVPLNPHYVLMMAGGNDYGTGAKQTAESTINELDQYYSLIVGIGASVVAGTYIPVNLWQSKGQDGADAQARMEQVNQWTRDTCNIRSYGLVDWYNIMEDPNNPKYCRTGDIHTDGVHPTVQGYDRMGSNTDISLFEEITPSEPAQYLIEAFFVQNVDGIIKELNTSTNKNGAVITQKVFVAK